MGWVLEAVSICNNVATCSGWVQIGWRKHESWSDPQFYFEYQAVGGSPIQLYAPLSHASHAYKLQYDAFDSVWDAYLDGVGKFSKGSLGFTSGTYLTAQGEVNSTHTQIGRNAPNKLLFSDMQYQNAAGQWPAFNVDAPLIVESPYGADEPAIGQLRNWTNGH